jgi:asparagine synthase (glutamine-hydrolysing)
MSKILKIPVKAFSIGFNEKEYSELEYAKIAAKKISVEHHTQIIEENGLEILPKLVECYGEPYADSSAIPTYYVSKFAREHVPMVLSGDGGDEIFGGYISYQRWMSYNPWANFINSLKRFKKKGTVRGLREGIKYRTLNSFSSDSHYLNEWLNKFMFYLKDDLRKNLWENKYSYLLKDKSEIFEEADRKAQSFDRLAYAQYIDINTYLHGDILTKVDIASMAHGLEVRPPIIDLKVMEFASKLPIHLRQLQNQNGSSTGKFILKKLLLKDFDESFVNRKKQGFSIPRELWFMSGTQSRNLVKDLLLQSSARVNEFFKPSSIEYYFKNHSSKKNYSSLLWLLVVLEIWLQQNKEVSFNN